jgi:hypothetical protein
LPDDPLGLSLHEILFHDLATIHPQIKGKVILPRSWKRRPGLPLDKVFIGQELDKVLVSDEYPPLSLRLTFRLKKLKQSLLQRIA